MNYPENTPNLFGEFHIIPACAHCHKPKGIVMGERDEATRRWNLIDPDTICCDPANEWTCPECGSDNVDTAPYDYGTDSETGYSDSGEQFFCLACGAKGDADDIRPSQKPWAELEAVAAQVDAARRKPVMVEDDLEMARRVGFRLPEVA
ncbi:MAG: hypothetical protein KGL39_41230 [Patescibacteria group bacterium]|nr:hypothetical protein [Patescibacteria group bacterium]